MKVDQGKDAMLMMMMLMKMVIMKKTTTIDYLFTTLVTVGHKLIELYSSLRVEATASLSNNNKIAHLLYLSFSSFSNTNFENYVSAKNLTDHLTLFIRMARMICHNLSTKTNCDRDLILRYSIDLIDLNINS